MTDGSRPGFSYADLLSPADPWSPAPLTPAPFTPAPQDADHSQSHPHAHPHAHLPMFSTGGAGAGGGGGGPGGGPGSTGPKHMHEILTMFNRPVQQISPFASTVSDQEPPDVSQIVSMYPHMFAPAATPGSTLPSLSTPLPGFPQQASLMEAHQLITKYMQQHGPGPASSPVPAQAPPASPFVAPAPRTPVPSANSNDAPAAALNSLRNHMKRQNSDSLPPTPTPSTPSDPKSRGGKPKGRKKSVPEEDEDEDEEDMAPPKKRGKGGDDKKDEQPRVHKLLKHRAIDAKSRNRLAGAFEALRQIVDVDHKMDKASLLTAASNMISNIQKEWDECKTKLQQEISKRQALEIAITQTPAAGETLSNVRLPNELPLPFFRNLFMDSTVQMVVLNLQRQCVEANDAFLKRHGWTREELIGKVIPSASKLIPALGNLYDPNLPFDFAPIKAGYPKNMTAAHLNPYPATILGLQKLFTQQEKSVTVVHRFINGRGQLIEGRVTHWLVLDGGKPLYTVGCTTDESVITLLE